MSNFKTTLASPLGPLIAFARSGNAPNGLVYRLTHLHIIGGKYVPDLAAIERADLPIFAQLQCELTEYFSGNRTQFAVATAPLGTVFQQRVWQALLAIPYGQTRSYAEQAQAIGLASAVRAVANANARNPIAIIVPCHRVIGSKGALTGYAGGLLNKVTLLKHEARESRFAAG